MWPFGLFLAGMSALLLPSWVALPFGVSTAAAGLYLAWVRRGGRGEARKEEGDTFHDIGECARAKYYFENPQEADAIVIQSQATNFWMNEKNWAALEKYYRRRVQNIFIDNFDPNLPESKNTIVYARTRKLADNFQKKYKADRVKWKNFKEEEKDINGFLEYTRDSFLRAFRA